MKVRGAVKTRAAAITTSSSRTAVKHRPLPWPRSDVIARVSWQALADPTRCTGTHSLSSAWPPSEFHWFYPFSSCAGTWTGIASRFLAATDCSRLMHVVIPRRELWWFFPWFCRISSCVLGFWSCIARRSGLLEEHLFMLEVCCCNFGIFKITLLWSLCFANHVQNPVMYLMHFRIQ